MSKFCGNCGASVDDNTVFCPNCGNKFETPEPVNAVPTGESYGAESVQPEQTYGAPENSAVQTEQPTGYYNQPEDVGQPYNSFDGMNDGGATVKGGNKNIVPIIIAAAVVILLIVVFAIVKFATRYEKIDAKELFDIDFSGPDGYGVCYAQLDVDPSFAYSEYDVYMEDYSISECGEDSSDVKYSGYFSDKRSTLEDSYKKASNKSDAKEMRDALLKVNKKTGEFKLTCKVSKDSGLKNGDKVTVEVEYDEDYLKENKIKLTDTEFEVEVKGLDDAETIDPFDGFNYEFTGNDGSGYISIDYYNDKYDFITYSLEDSSYNLSNGDTVSVEASAYVYDYEYIDSEDESKGFWFKYDDKFYVWPYENSYTTKEFTVEGLKELTEIDPFEGITFDYSYATPYLYINDVEVPEDSVLYGNVSYSIDDSYSKRYAVGESFTVKCYAYSSLADEGYKLAGTPDDNGYVTKEFTVDDTMPSYISSKTTADDMATVNATFADLAESYKDGISGSYLSGGASLDSSVKSVTSMNQIAQYVINPEGFESGSIADGTYNYYGRLYELNLKLQEGTATAYVFIYTSNVSIYDGEVYLGSTLLSEASDYNFSRISAVKKNEIIKKLKESGTLTELTSASDNTSSDTDSSTADSSSVTDSSSAAAADTSSAADSSSVADSSSATDSKTDDSDSSEIVP